MGNKRVLLTTSANTNRGPKVAEDYVKTGTAVDTHSSFGAHIEELFKRIKPRKIIETGTYLGRGTTTIIANTLNKLAIDDAIFCTIEVKPENYAKAKQYFEANNMNVRALHGLSVPRHMLPTMDDIQKSTVSNIGREDIYVDHKENNRVQLYFKETYFPDVQDDLLGKILKVFNNSPDFVLLDSGGHMGYVEFKYLVEHLKGPCYIALDDIYHVKHYKSFEYIKNDPRFEIVVNSKEKFGFCIAKFMPNEVQNNSYTVPVKNDSRSIQKVLIVRSDSIGDFIIFGGSLKYYKKLYPQAEITLAVSDIVTDLAVACPHVDSVMSFNRKKMVYDRQYSSDFIKEIQADNYDVAIAPALSRDKVSDFVVMNSGAAERITSCGDSANLPLEQLRENDKHFTKIVPMSDGLKLETVRNEEFLKALDIQLDSPYRPDIWLTKDDISYAADLLGQLGVNEPVIIAPFAQNSIRDWSSENWARLISMHADQQIVVVGLQSDRAKADQIIKLSDQNNIHNICGQTTIRQLAALISKAKACIGCESAAVHIAATVNVPNVVLLGGGHFGRFMPYADSTQLVYNKMNCFNCNWNCRYGQDIRCISSITVDMVEQKLSQILDNNFYTVVTDERNQCLVSAIVSTYNSEDFIQGCLEDLVNQSLYKKGKLEIIVVNSGSQQNEEQIVKRFQENYSNIVYIKTQDRESIYTAWNRAVKVAKGQFFTNANTDDRHRQDALEVMASELVSNPDVALVYGDQIVTKTANDTFENHHGVDFTPRSDYSHERMLFGCCVGSQPMWRAKLHEELGYFDETLTCASDWDFWLRVSEKYDIKRIPKFLGLYYHNEQGIEHGKKNHSLYERYIVGKRFGNPYISIIPLYQHKDNPLVSVIIPAYNAADTIGESIESVLIQNYPKLELIIVDDGSDDETAEVVRGYDDERIKYFRKENGGASSARNLAIEKSTGQYIVPLDSDDKMTLDFIAQHLKAFEENPQADLVYCDDRLIDSKGNPIRVITRPEYSDRKLLIRDLFRCGFPVVPFRTCIKRDVFDKIGFFNEYLKVAEDYDMMRRFIKQGLVACHLKGDYYLRRIETNSLSRSHTPAKAKFHFDVVKSFTESFDYEQLFPDVQWDKVAAENRQMHARFLFALTFMTIGQDYVKTNSPVMAKAGFDYAQQQLDMCLEISPDNVKAIQLMQKCKQIRYQFAEALC